MDDELRRLRARAYGPEADIADDPAALARLEELERRARGAAQKPERGDEPAPARDPERAAEPGQAPDEAASGQRREVDAAPHRSTFGWAVAWAASLVVVALAASLTAVVSMYVLTRPVTDGDALQVDVVELGPKVLAPRFLGIDQRADSRGNPDYLGLTIIVVQGTWHGDTGDECLAVLPADAVDPNSDFTRSRMYTACSAGELPAVLQLRVNEEMPAELRERFPVDTGLRFVLDGSRVGVFIADG